MHFSVMVEEVLHYLAVRPDATYVDATAGLGGHTAAIARQLTTGRVVANDRDLESLDLARERTAEWKERILYLRGRFSELESGLERLGIRKVDGLLADLGPSRYQLTSSERGFSLMEDGPLDMRMEHSQETTAADFVNHIAEKALADLIYHLGEERRHRTRKIARAIVRARPIRSTLHLANVIESVVPRTHRLHPATKTFMALRLAVNRELEELDQLLEAAPRLVGSGGRIVVMSFMSLEDRKTKRCFQSLAREGRATILTKHVVRPAKEEVRRNPPSRGAKLRALEMN